MNPLDALNHLPDASPSASRDGLWATLQERVDASTYAPAPHPAVEAHPQQEDGHSFVVLRSPRDAYMRLTLAEYALWQRMDGIRTVGQLAYEAFQQHKQLLPVGELVGELQRQGFLLDQPVGVYRSVQAALQRGRLEHWGQALVRALRERRWTIANIDGMFDRLYRWGGWLCFTWPFVLLSGCIAALGLALLLRGLLLGRGVPPLSLNGSLALGLCALAGMLLVATLLHELAHGLAVKHYGRRVRRGGVMLYFGLPAAFVDTSDVWAEPPRHRMVVSAAGLACDLLLGGLGMLLATLLPASAFAPLGARLALACYGAALFNLNPLLELDGYYMLVDLLRKPNLRGRALAYVRGPLWERLRLLQPLRGEERVLAAFGIAASVYLVVASVLALLFWRHQARELLGPLWRAGNPVGQALVVAVTLLLAAPIALGLLLAAYASIRGVVGWLLHHGYGRRTGLIALLMVLATALLALLPFRFGTTSPVTLLAAAMLWGAALACLWLLRAVYRGAALALSLEFQLLSTALMFGAVVLRALTNQGATLPLGLEWLALAALFVATVVALPSASIENTPRHELLLCVLLLLLAFPVAGLALLLANTPPQLGLAQLLLRAMPVYLGMLVLALLLPMVLALRGSRVLGGRVLLWFGAAAQVAAYLLDFVPGITLAAARAADIVAAGLWCAAWAVHLIALHQLSFDNLMPVARRAASDERARLASSFRSCYGGLYLALVAVYGRRRAQLLDDRMDVAAATADWHIVFDREQARPTVDVLNLELARQGARYAEVLRFTLALVAGLAGDAFAKRALQAAYDALPWAERETADRYIFPTAPWASELGQRFHSLRDARLRLLRSLDFFLPLDDNDLQSINAALVEQPLAVGEVLLRKGARPPGIWLVDVGEVVGWRDGTLVEELHRGDVVAAWSLTDEQPSALTYRASVASTLLFLPHAALNPLLRAQLRSENRASAAVLSQLERVPLFAELPRHQLRLLAQQARRQSFAPRALIVRQGQPSGKLYIIQRGQAAVVTTTAGQGRIVARLGPDELFGELEFLRRQPPVASVVALGELDVLAFEHSALEQLLVHDGVAQNLERIGTGRLLTLHQC